MLVTTIVIAVIFAVALLGWRATGGGSESSTSSAGTWEQIALVNRTTGAVTTVDDEGKIINEIEGAGRTVAVHTLGSRIALVGTNQVAIIDTRAPEAEAVIVEFDRGSTITAVPTSDDDSESLHLVIGKPTGGNVQVIDVGDGSVIDVFAAAAPVTPLIFAETVRWASDGSAFAMADAANFQTILVQPGEDGAVFLPDQPIAVGDKLVATGRTVGLQADVALVDHDRRNQALVPSEIPAGGVMVDDRLLMVSVDGGVYRVERGDELPERIGAIAVPGGDQVAWVRPSLNHRRLVVAGETFQSVVGVDGDTIFTTSFSAAIDVARPHPDWACLPIGGEDNFHSLISLETGELLADLTGLEVTGTSSDGCTVVGERDGVSELVDRVGSVRLGQLRDAELGPDGRTVVWTTTTGRSELIAVDDALTLADPVDLSHASPSSLIVAFLTG
jgi:hypothetical protein